MGIQSLHLRRRWQTMYMRWLILVLKKNIILSNIPNWDFGTGAVGATSERLLVPFCARLWAFDLLKNLRMTRALVSAAFLVRPGVARARFSSQHGSFWKLERLIFVPLAPSVRSLRNIGRSYDFSTSELARDTPKSTKDHRNARLRFTESAAKGRSRKSQR